MNNGFNRIDSTANRLKQAMDQRKKKAADIVRETGLDRGSISHYRSGKYEPKQQAIYKLAKALDVSEMWLWGYDCPMERPIEQKENDELVDLVERLKRDEGFRRLVLSLSKMNPSKIESIMNILDINDSLNS